MAEKTKIQWTDATINFWTGCKKVSPGCKYCYMYRDKERYGVDPTEVIKVQSKTVIRVLRELTAQRLEREAAGNFEPLKIFTCSWSDFFIKEADQWRPEAWATIKAHPEFIWQILTKRHERIEACLPDDWGDGYPNVWLGVSIEGNDQRDRLNTLMALKKERSVFKTFVSYEPAIDYLELENDDVLTSYNFDRLDWMIIGGESGNDNGKYLYRPCNMEWMVDMINQCTISGVPVFVKQMGTHLAKTLRLKDRNGGDINEWLPQLQVRQFPKN